MPKTIRFKHFENFINYNREFINENPVANIFLIKNLEIAYKSPKVIIDFFNIEKENEKIIVLFVEQTCLIYGNLHSKASIEHLTNELNFEKFKNYSFAGNRIIIHKLLNFNECIFNEIKYLSIYKCVDTNEILLNDIKILTATLDNFEEVKNIHEEFNREFYAGYDIVPIISEEYLKNSLLSGNFFLIRNETEIMSIACYRKEYDFPELNFVFTRKKYRGNNYAQKLTFYLTNRLLKNHNDFVMLYTKGDNLGAKKCFENVGYELVYEYTMSFKKNNVS